MIVLDTHVFLWYALADLRLPKRARDLLELDPEQIAVPTACAWEMMLLAARGRLALGRGDPASILHRWIQESGFQVAPLSWEIAVLSRTLPFGHEDPADRFIAATAFAYNAELATSDTQLRSLSWLKLAY